ncbi:aminotransferase [uncultured Alsobacter sp.]|uniref:aminotransferase n=1 Tax=uncultured Alsobacter sp. TaxID=1748258 RepID=UPI0025FF4CC9|nr:aminotransferase [uncultured Alsobacter sp.]
MAAVNSHLLDTGTPPIPEAKAWARRYDGSRGPLIDLSQAVPGYPAHPDLLARIAAAAGEAATASYGPIGGDTALVDTYAAHVSEFYGAPVSPAEISLTAGCNLAFFVAMMATAKAGDAVLLPSPWYFNHEMALRMSGIETRPLPCRPEAGFVPDPDDAERLLDGRVRAIVLVTPNNPTGAVYPPGTIARFAELCRRKRLWLILDETYRDFLPGEGDVPHALFSDAGWRDVLIGLYSFSKSYCVPGHRLGAIIAAASLQAEIGKILDTVQICPPRVAQGAVAWGVGALADWREANRLEIAGRAAAFTAAMGQAPDWRVDSVGAYFAYVAHPFAGVPAPVVAERLAVERGVLGLPGGYFGPGQDGHLRIAFANADAAALAQLPARLAGFGI